MVWLIAEGELIERFNLNHTEHWIHMCRRNNNRELTQHAQQLKGERQILLVWTFSVIKLSPHADFAANSSWVSGSRLRAHKLIFFSSVSLSLESFTKFAYKISDYLNLMSFREAFKDEKDFPCSTICAKTFVSVILMKIVS